MDQKEKNGVKSHILGRFYLFVGIALFAIVLFIAAALFRFKNQVYDREYNMQMNTLKELSAQGSAVLEERLTGYLNTLAGVALLFQEGDLWAEEKIECLRRLVDMKKIDFPRMGIADTNGKAMMTSGAIVDISNAEYYKAALNKKGAISESHTSKLIDDQVFMAAVPVLDEDQEVRGVLFGIVEVEDFRVFDQTSLNELEHYIKVIDRNGDYLVNMEEFSVKVQADNMFDLLNQVKSSVTAEQAQKQMKSGEKILAQINDGEKDYVVYFTPLRRFEWYVVTVMERQGILEKVEYLLGGDIYWLMAEVGLAFALVCFGIGGFLWQDKKKTEEAYRQLQINSRMIHTAFSCTGSIILIYNPEKDLLGIINRENILIPLPEILEHASENLIKLLPDHYKTRSQVEKIFQRLVRMKEDEDFELSLKINGEIRSYILHVKVVVDSERKAVRNVGVVEDITEKRNLQEQAEIDFLTGIYNRRSATERINHILAEKPDGDRIHAFVILDLDGFKKLNDTLGHGRGDQALKTVADILGHHFRESDVISRLAGDEFVVFVRNIPEDVLGKNMEILLGKLQIVYEEKGSSVEITASAGIAAAPRDGEDFDALYYKADKALYQAKESGKNTWIIYQTEENDL